MESILNEKQPLKIGMITVRQEKILWIGLIFTVLVPLVIPVGHIIMDAAKSPIIYHESDFAAIEINTISAMHGRQLLGVYSRFAWNHPGPMFFYLMAPMYVLGGMNCTSLILACIIIVLIFAMAVMAVVHSGCRGSSRIMAYSTAVLLAVYLWKLPVCSIWNPDVLYLPFVLYMFLCALLIIGRVWTLPAIMFVGSFLIQTHLGTAPCVVAIGLMSSTLCFSQRLSNTLGFRVIPQGSARISVATSLAILVICWFLPLLEEFTHDPGNISKIFQFFIRPQEHHDLWIAFVTFSKEVSWMRLLLPGSVWSEGYPGKIEAVSMAVGVSQLFLLALAYRMNLMKHQYFNAALSLVIGVGALVAVLSIATIRGPIHGFLVRWMSGFGLVSYTVILSMAIDSLGFTKCFQWSLDRSRLTLWTGLALITCSIIATLWSTYDLRERSSVEYAPRCLSENEIRIKELSECLCGFLEAEKISRPLIRWEHNRWPIAIGLLLQLVRAKKNFGQSGLNLGDYYVINGREAISVIIKGEPELDIDRPDYHLICSYRWPEKALRDYYNGDTFIYQYDPDYTRKHRFRGHVKIVEASNVAGDPKLLCDAVFPANGTPWNNPECLILKDISSFVTFAKPEDTVEGLQISADGNDCYSICCSQDGASFAEIGVIPKVTGGGMQTREFFSKLLNKSRFIRIAPKHGDGCYSLGGVDFIISDSHIPKTK